MNKFNKITYLFFNILSFAHTWRKKIVLLHILHGRNGKLGIAPDQVSLEALLRNVPLLCTRHFRKLFVRKVLHYALLHGEIDFAGSGMAQMLGITTGSS